jgi:hypothetical protein
MILYNMERRRVLKGGAMLLAAGAGGLSGCVGLGDSSEEASTVGTDRLETWLPDPRALDSNLDHYQFDATAPAALSEATNLEAFGSFDQNTTPESDASADVNVGTLQSSDVDLTFSASANPADDADSYGFRAYFGSFDGGWLETKLRNNDYDQVGGEGDFTLYEDGDNAAGSRVTAVSDDILLAGAQQASDDSDTDAVQVIETLIETGNGDVDGYVDQIEDMSELLSALPAGHDFSGGTNERGEETVPAEGRFENLVAEGVSRRIDGSETEVTRALVFLDEVDVVDRDIEAYIEKSDDFTDFSVRPEFDTDNGRVVTIEGRSA